MPHCLRRPALLGLILLLPLSACGAVQEKIEGGVLSAEQKWKEQAMQQRQQMCDAAQGTYSDVDVSACVDGVATLDAGPEHQRQPCTGGEATHYDGQCLQQDANGLIYFSDGPSVPYEFLNVGKEVGEGADLSTWNGFFWAAGVNHDYCYHHGAPTYAYVQADCDAQMLDDLVALCSQKDNSSFPWFSKDRCSVNAQIMYTAVRAFGDTNFKRMSTRVSYPPYEPLWRSLGFTQQPDDPALRGAIDSVL